MKRLLTVLAAAFSLAGCDDTATGPERAADVRQRQYIDCIEEGGTGSTCADLLEGAEAP